MLKTPPTSQITPTTPRPIWYVSSGAMLLHLLLGRLTWIDGHFELFGLFRQLLLDLDLLVVANFFARGSQQPVTVPTLGHGVASTATIAGSYRRAVSRLHAA